MIEAIHGSPFALRHDGPGSDPADKHYSEDWTSVLKLIGDEYMTLRRFPSREDALDYLSRQLRAAPHREEKE